MLTCCLFLFLLLWYLQRMDHLTIVLVSQERAGKIHGKCIPSATAGGKPKTVTRKNPPEQSDRRKW